MTPIEKARLEMITRHWWFAPLQINMRMLEGRLSKENQAPEEPDQESTPSS